MKARTEYRLGWLLLIIVVLAGLGLRWPWPADEPRFALIAQEMVNTGHWLIPHRVGELYPDKPPIFMWAIAVLLWLKVPLKVAFLLPSALAGLATVALTVDLAKRLFGQDVATKTLWLLAFTLQLTLQAKTAQIDMLVVFWITLGTYGLLRHLLLGPAWSWYFLGFAAAGFGVITKGVGVLALFALLPLLWRPDLRARLDKRAWLGPLMLLAAIATWGLPMLWYAAHSANPEAVAYRDNILFNQTANRYVHSLGHQAPWYYYIAEVIPAFWLPLSLLAPFMIKRWWQEKQRPEILLPLVMVVAIVLFFSISPGKRGVYLTPATPWLAMAIAPFLGELSQRPWVRRLWLGLMWLLTALILGAAALPKVYHLAGVMGVLFLALSGAAMAAVLLLSGKAPLWRRWGMMMAALWIGYSMLGTMAIGPYRTPIDIMAKVGERMGPDGQLGLVHFKEQFALFADRPVVQFGYHESNQQQLATARHWLTEAPNKRYIFGPKETLKGCFILSPSEFMGTRHGGDWYLVQLKQMQPDCAAGVKPGPIYQGPAYGVGH
ncbi:glycosyltransferase family 39 protein [Gallaecimonas sp. GXIMD1310]|uniref:ArnT family glycosyltransferase n=1 Tax=Gallaecimonas sp. GXIMD1310 TaxID=3131926 RepID=UPI00324CFC34